MKGILEGLTVLDLSLQLPGPFCSLMMADYGADVIKIDEPYPRKRISFDEEKGPGLSPWDLYLNRNKRSLTLNLKDSRGKEAFYRLVRDADVVMEGFRPGVVSRLGVDYETLKEINPEIVYCSISGFGQTGPRKDEAAHDINYISYAGILGLNGKEGGPPAIPPVQVADLGGGALMALSGILMALFARDRKKEGNYVDVSMFDGAFSWLSVHAAIALFTGYSPERGAAELTGRIPGYNVYRCSDGKYLSVGALEPWFFNRLMEIVGRDDLKGRGQENDPEKKTVEELSRIFATKSRDEWMEIFASEDVCVSPIYDLMEAFKDPQVKSREMLIDLEHPAVGPLRQVGFPLKFSAGGGEIRRRAPYLGEDNGEILSRLGFSTSEVEELERDGVIRRREDVG